MEDFADFDEDTKEDYSQPTRRNLIIDDEAEEAESYGDSFDSDTGTLTYGSEVEPFRSPSLFEPLNERRRVVSISTESLKVFRILRTFLVNLSI